LARLSSLVHNYGHAPRTPRRPAPPSTSRASLRLCPCSGRRRSSPSWQKVGPWLASIPSQACVPTATSTFTFAGNTISVDLHSGFFGLEKDGDTHIFSRSRLVDLNGEGVCVPSIEDHIRLLSLHLLRHGLNVSVPVTRFSTLEPSRLVRRILSVPSPVQYIFVKDCAWAGPD